MDYSKVCWLLDTLLQERVYECGFPTLEEAAKNMGCRTYQTKYVRFSLEEDPNIPFTSEDCVVTHGTIQFNNQLRNRKWCPGSYFNSNVKLWSNYAPYLSPLLLNDDYYILPYGEFLRRGIKKGDAFFIKPNSGMKEFTGKVINWGNFDDETNSSKQLEKIADETLCVISSVKEILSEFRYVIANRKVITGSEYRWDDVLDVRVDTLPECDDMAKCVAEMEWQADTVYVCDVAMTEDGPKVIELNAFSSSGLYACDTTKIVKAVSEVAWKEYNGDLE